MILFIVLSLALSPKPQAGLINWCAYWLERKTGHYFASTLRIAEERVEMDLEAFAQEIQKTKTFTLPSRKLNDRVLNALLPHLKGLENLDLSRNPALGSRVVERLVAQNKDSLKKLRLGMIGLDSRVIREISELPDLRALQIDHIRDAHLRFFYGHKTLRELDLHLGRFSKRSLKAFLRQQPEQFYKLVIRSPRTVREIEEIEDYANQHQHRAVYQRGENAGELKPERTIYVSTAARVKNWRWSGRLSDVTDGDSFSVNIDDIHPGVFGRGRGGRVYGIDAPEYGIKAVTYYEGLVAYVARYHLYLNLLSFSRDGVYPVATLEDDKYGKRFLIDFMVEGQSIGQRMISSKTAVSYLDGEEKPEVDWKAVYAENRESFEKDLKSFGRILKAQGLSRTGQLAEELYEDFVRANKRLPPQAELEKNTSLTRKYFRKR